MLSKCAHFEVGFEHEAGRAVIKNERQIALMPWWAVWPFELLLLPYRRHIPRIGPVGEDCLCRYPVQTHTKRYDNFFSCSFAYPFASTSVLCLAKLTHPRRTTSHTCTSTSLRRSSGARELLVGALFRRCQPSLARREKCSAQRRRLNA